jgi:hypothetical protein
LWDAEGAAATAEANAKAYADELYAAIQALSVEEIERL